MAGRPPQLDQKYRLIADYDFRSRITSRVHLYENFYTRYRFSGGSLDALSGNGEKSIARDIHILDPERGGLFLPLMLNGSVFGGAGSFWAGLVRTRRTFAPPFYVEARIRPPRLAQGAVSAVWATPSDIDAKPEVDVVEIVSGPNDTTRRSYHNLHRGYPDRGDVPAAGLLVQSGGSVVYEPGYDYANRMTTFGALVTPGRVVHYIENKEIANRALDWRIQATGDLAPPAHIIANIWTGGDWAGSPQSGDDLPCFMTIEFLRVWRYGD